jgi:ubiquinone/menaquinone biosynthesis C-methylase UbiE
MTESVYYSQIAQYYDKVRIQSPDYLDYWSEKIKECGKISSNSLVLEIGCGTGRFTFPVLKKSQALIYAVEPSDEMLSKAKEKYPQERIVWIKGEVEKLPFCSNSFDCAYMTFVIHHFEDKVKGLEEVFRVLKKSGRCLILTFPHSHLKKSPSRFFPKVLSIDLARYPSLVQLRKYLEMAGFKKVFYHLSKDCKENLTINEYLSRFKNKYISTLNLLTEKEFQKGYEIFEKKIRELYEKRVQRTIETAIIVGEK